MLTLDRSVARMSMLVAALIAGTSAAAQGCPVLPLTQFGLQAQNTFGNGSAGIVSSGAFSASGGNSSSGPVVAVHGDGPRSNATNGNMASAQALWAFQIAGPAGVVVPIVITGLYSASASAGNSAIASGGLAIGEDRFRLTYIMTFRCQSLNTSGCDSANGNHSQSFELASAANSGAETFISISVGGVVQPPAGSLGQFDAFLDPIVIIDPTFARASEFTLFVSPDAYGTVAAVPEPETYSLLLAGLGIVAAIARRRRRG